MTKYFKGQTVPAHKSVIMVHCLATGESWGKGKPIKDVIKDVTRWHVVDNRWSAIGYGAVIGYGGDWGLGRDLDNDGNVLEETAAAASGWNKKAIHLALVGGRTSQAKDQFSDHYTHLQEEVLLEMIEEIQNIAGRPLEVMGHNQVAAKACPGFHAPTWYEEAKARAKSRVVAPVVDTVETSAERAIAQIKEIIKKEGV